MNLEFQLPFGQWVEVAIDWIVTTFAGFFAVLQVALQSCNDFLYNALAFPPNWVLIILIMALAWAMRGWRLALGALIGLSFIIAVGQWDNSLRTLALVLVASAMALLIAIPLGIWAGRSDRASRVLRPILDFFQTMPAMVYLIPALILFGVGVVPGIFATVLFALPPGVRMTELGIRGVDSEMVEAGRAFGSTPGRILRQIQLPLAMPSIMAGVNQVIMLSLSMVVIAGMVGASGLGQEVTTSLGQADIALGFEAGMSVVVLAMLLDRITGSIGKRKFNPTWVKITAIVVVIAMIVANVLTGSGITSNKHENGDDRVVTIGVFNGWPESVVTSELLKYVLEEQGYTVNLEYGDPAPVFTGLQNGTYDLTTNVWLPITHESYMDEYGQELVDLGSWYDEARLTFAVNADAPIDSLDQLAANADKFGNRIVGIEPGAGLTKITQEELIPGYGLEGMDYVLSSTPGMLTELRTAQSKGENIVVTLWAPHWPYSEFDIKNLEDPQGLLGGNESIHIFGSSDFEQRYPTLSEWLGDFEMAEEPFSDLANIIFNENANADPAPLVADWVEENREWVDGLDLARLQP